jgi:acetoin utilization protein AcuB
MIPNPITIAHNQTVEQATQLMARYKIRRLPVIKGGKLAGIVSDRDLRQLGRRPSLKLPVTEQEEAYQNLSVEEVMTPAVITVREYDTIKTAIELMLKNTISGLPVVDRQDTLVGMLSNTDILKHCLTVLEQQEEQSSD